MKINYLLKEKEVGTRRPRLFSLLLLIQLFTLKIIQWIMMTLGAGKKKAGWTGKNVRT